MKPEPPIAVLVPSATADSKPPEEPTTFNEQTHYVPVKTIVTACTKSEAHIIDD